MKDDARELVITAMEWLQSEKSGVAPPPVLGKWSEFELSDIEQLLSTIDANWTDSRPYNAQRLETILQQMAASVIQRRHDSLEDLSCDPRIEPALISSVYSRLAEVTSNAAGHCLQILSAQGDALSLDTLAGILRDDSPTRWEITALAVSPLFQLPPDGLGEFFEHLGSSILNVTTVGPLLDLANYAARRGILDVHPCEDHAKQLIGLLGHFVERLSKMEENPRAFSEDLLAIQKMLSESIAITVSVCDALGLIGDASAEGKLNQALALTHRRIQAEAAGALARIGNEEGKRRLVALASDPVARLRAVAYAEELGFDDELPDEVRTPEALAEGEMAAWLASGDRFGFPPNELELIDQRTQFWPSFEDPQVCYLWRYTYRLPNANFSNIGISGPVTHAFRANLADMALDDIYAVYAGWQGQHEDIYEIISSKLNAAQRQAVMRLEKLLGQKRVEDIETVALTFFFGEPAILALGTRAERKICAVTDSLETILFPVSATPASLTPDLVLAIYRGRKMLRTFNSSREDDQGEVEY